MSPISKTDPETERIRKIQGEIIKNLLDITGKNAIDLYRYVGYSKDIIRKMIKEFSNK